MVASRVKRKGTHWMDVARPYMSSHRTSKERYSPKDSALLVIDMQRYFLDESSHAFFPASKEIVENLQALISVYRSRSLPVIFTRQGLLKNEKQGAMGRWWGDVLRIDDEMSELAPSFVPLENETVLRKSRYSAFAGTDLEKRLRRKGTSGVVITGVLTHLCCESTARDAFMRDFDVFFVVDGTASDNEELHVSSLRTLTDGFAIPVTTAEVIARIEQM